MPVSFVTCTPSAAFQKTRSRPVALPAPFTTGGGLPVLLALAWLFVVAVLAETTLEVVVVANDHFQHVLVTRPVGWLWKRKDRWGNTNAEVGTRMSEVVPFHFRVPRSHIRVQSPP